MLATDPCGGARLVAVQALTLSSCPVRPAVLTSQVFLAGDCIP